MTVRGGVTAEGRLSFWDYRVYFAGERGAAHFYDIPHHRTLAHSSKLDAPTGVHPSLPAWRAAGEQHQPLRPRVPHPVVAAQAGVDPVEFGAEPKDPPG